MTLYIESEITFPFISLNIYIKKCYR